MSTAPYLGGQTTVIVTVSEHVNVLSDCKRPNP